MKIIWQSLMPLAVAGTLASVQVPVIAHPKAAGCTADQGKAADESTDALLDWRAIAAFYDRFRQCDDGAIAESVSDSIGKLLARERPEVDELVALARSRKGLEHFALRHVDATLDDNDLKSIAEQLPARCVPANKKLCHDFSAAARQALAESMAARDRFRAK